MTGKHRKCRLCKAPVKGRSDKIFCTLACKNEYHLRLRRATAKEVVETDKILHRNRSILLEVMGKNSTQKKIPKTTLDKKKFNPTYMTGFYINKQDKTYYLVYDFAWMEFSSGEVLIIRRSNRWV
jgi:hypothetical protein